MITIILLLLFIIRLIFDNSIIYSGAYNGLMLWYTRIVPLLLPFLLLSSILTNKILNYCYQAGTRKKDHKSTLLPTCTCILLGTFCGCPIGAKTVHQFSTNNQLDIKTANLLMPLCNNISPIFLTGYICNYILKNSVPFYQIVLLIYIPYFIYGVTIFIYLHVIKPAEHIKTRDYTYKNITNIELSSIIQITYIGIYIMICSIVIEFIKHYKPFYEPINVFTCGLTEVTTGANLISQTLLPIKIKTALILSITSFGGICTLLQTKKVINKSRLSIIYYTVIKLICAFCTYKLAILIL